MESIGNNIVKMQTLINTPLAPPPAWIRKWQMEAEHILYLANMAKDKDDMDGLRALDVEAARLVAEREKRGHKS